MRQKITVLGFFSEDSGLTSFFKTNYRILVASGYAFNIINIANYRPARDLTKYGKYYEIPHYLSDINRKNFLQKRLHFNRQLHEVYAECRLNSSVIHLFLNDLCDSFAISCAHKSGFERIILHAYTDYPKTFNFTQRRLQSIGMRIAERYATDYLAATKEIADYFYSKRIQKSPRFRVLKSGIAVRKQRFHEEQNIFYRKRYGIEQDTFVIGNVGRFTTTKNQRFLVASFCLFHKIYPNTKLVLIGDGPEIEVVRKQVYDLHLEDSVIFTGFLENTEEVQNIFNIFAYPVLVNGMSLSLLHSIANGALPVISIPRTFDVDVINSISILPPENPQQWADEFHRLSQHPYDRRLQCDDAMSELILQGYTVSTSTRELRKLYGNIQWEEYV